MNNPVHIMQILYVSCIKLIDVDFKVQNLYSTLELKYCNQMVSKFLKEDPVARLLTIFYQFFFEKFDADANKSLEIGIF